MISKALLKEYDFSHEHDYYDYIIDSYINGQFGQVKELFQVGTRQQRKDCITWCYEMGQKEIGDYLWKLL